MLCDPAGPQVGAVQPVGALDVPQRGPPQGGRRGRLEVQDLPRVDVGDQQPGVFFSVTVKSTKRPEAFLIRYGCMPSVPGRDTWRTVPPGRVSRTFTATPAPWVESETIRPSPVGTVQPGSPDRGRQSRSSWFSSQLQSGVCFAGAVPATGTV